MHLHRYKIKAVQPCITNETWGVERIGTRYTTEILKICIKCGKIKIKEVKGHWKREELT